MKRRCTSWSLLAGYRNLRRGAKLADEHVIKPHVPRTTLCAQGQYSHRSLGSADSPLREKTPAARFHEGRPWGIGWLYTNHDLSGLLPWSRKPFLRVCARITMYIYTGLLTPPLHLAWIMPYQVLSSLLRRSAINLS